VMLPWQQVRMTCQQMARLSRSKLVQLADLTLEKTQNEQA
jgi:hypothetical protein